MLTGVNVCQTLRTAPGTRQVPHKVGDVVFASLGLAALAALLWPDLESISRPSFGVPGIV